MPHALPSFRYFFRRVSQRPLTIHAISIAPTPTPVTQTSATLVALALGITPLVDLDLAPILEDAPTQAAS